MFTNVRGIRALQQLRIEHQESAGLDFPQACLTEMLILYDVCKSLELSIFQAQEVLDAPACELVVNYLNGHDWFPTERATELVNTVLAM